MIFNLEWNMLQKLIKFSIENKLTIGILTVALIIWGGWSLSQLPFDSTPDITNNQVQVITQAPSLGAQEVEQFITTPVEMALANIPRVTERRSISRSGLSVITLVFDDAADVYWARQQVSQQLKEAEEVLPQGKGTVGLAPVTTGLGEIYHYTIRAKRLRGQVQTYRPAHDAGLDCAQAAVRHGGHSRSERMGRIREAVRGGD